MDYKKLSLVLKYSHDAFHSILNSMTHHDWVGGAKADMAKRMVLADAYKEMMGNQGLDTEADEGVHALSNVGPAMYNKGRIQPGKLITHALINGWSNPELYESTPEERIKESGRTSRYGAGINRFVQYTPDFLNDTTDDIESSEDPSVVHSYLHPSNHGSSWSVRKQRIVPLNHNHSMIHALTGEII